ncbi:MAG: hypothetical protein H8E13_04320 [Actinobacteria bacterium]|nr:hypothetical protein [Actinomycetota bacterium]
MIGEVFGFISKIIKPVTDLVDDLHTSAEEKEEIKLKIKELENKFRADAIKYEAKIIESQASIVKAEVQGQSILQRIWRPILMLSIVAIVVNNYILFPYLSAFTDKVQVLDLPTGLWTLMTVGVGGYVAGRSWEKGKGI